jgi:hypothetical protein
MKPNNFSTFKQPTELMKQIFELSTDVKQKIFKYKTRT